MFAICLRCVLMRVACKRPELHRSLLAITTLPDLVQRCTASRGSGQVKVLTAEVLLLLLCSSRLIPVLPSYHCFLLLFAVYFSPSLVISSRLEFRRRSTQRHATAGYLHTNTKLSKAARICTLWIVKAGQSSKRRQQRKGLLRRRREQG